MNTNYYTASTQIHTHTHTHTHTHVPTQSNKSTGVGATGCHENCYILQGPGGTRTKASTQGKKFDWAWLVVTTTDAFSRGARWNINQLIKQRQKWAWWVVMTTFTIQRARWSIQEDQYLKPRDYLLLKLTREQSLAHVDKQCPNTVDKTDTILPNKAKSHQRKSH